MMSRDDSLLRVRVLGDGGNAPNLYVSLDHFAALRRVFAYLARCWNDFASLNVYPVSEKCLRDKTMRNNQQVATQLFEFLGLLALLVIFTLVLV